MIDKELHRAVLQRSVVYLPNLIIKSTDPLAPVYFFGNRGGNYRNISMNAITGMFSARSISFAQGSKVSISIPQGDVILNTNNVITTNLVSLYSATAPVVLKFFPLQQPSTGVASFSVSLLGINFRNLNPGDITLSFRQVAPAAPIPDCGLSVPTNMINTVGSVKEVILVFLCITKFTHASNDEIPFLYHVFLNYFGGSSPLSHSFQVNVAVGSSIVTMSNLIMQPTNVSALPTPSVRPNNLCAVGAEAASLSNTLTSSGFVPTTNPVEFEDRPVLISFPDASLGPAMTFSCRAARSLSIGSHSYSFGNQPSPMSLLGKFPTMFQPSSTFTYQDSDTSDGNLPDVSPEAKISEHDQRQIAFFARKVLNGTLDYLIINVFGSGANLPVSCLSYIM